MELTLGTRNGWGGTTLITGGRSDHGPHAGCGPEGVPPFVSGAAHSRGGGAAVALCPSLVGC